jgi:hypothetical protein
MKTKKEIQESLIKRYLLNKKESKFLPIGYAVGLASVIVWYHCHDITYANVWYFMAKYGVIALGIGILLTELVMLFTKIDIEKEQQRLKDKIRENKSKIHNLGLSISPSSPLTETTIEEIKIFKKIKKLEQKILKLEAELEMITPK